MSEALLTPNGWMLPQDEKGSRKRGVSPGELASGATTPTSRMSGESKRVTFSDYVTDVDDELVSRGAGDAQER